MVNHDDRKLLVCGSRTFNDYPMMRRRLDALLQNHRITEVINGAMAGADALSSFWAYERHIDTEPVGAKWGTDGNSAAGPIRNQRMLSMLEPGDLVVAFVDKALDSSRGTRNMVAIARAKGFHVDVWSTIPDDEDPEDASERAGLLGVRP